MVYVLCVNYDQIVLSWFFINIFLMIFRKWLNLVVSYTQTIVGCHGPGFCVDFATKLCNLGHVTRLLFMCNSRPKWRFFENINKFWSENLKLAKFGRKLHIKNLSHFTRLLFVCNSWPNHYNSSEIFFEKSRWHNLVMVSTFNNLSHGKSVDRFLFVCNS